MTRSTPSRSTTLPALAAWLLVGLALGTAAQAELEPESRSFETSDGVRIHYLEAGPETAVPVLLIHGYTGSAEGNWFSNGIAERLAGTHRVLAIDVRGHGQSEKPHDAEKYGERIWKDALELLDHLDIDRAHVHGYSMGGAITTQLLAHAPERFLTASYGGSGVREVDEEWIAKLPPDAEGTDPQEAEARQTLSASPHRDEIALQLVRDTWQQAFAAPIDLTSLEIPVLAINGEFDRPIERTQRMRRELRHFKSVVLPGKSHLTAVMQGYIPVEYGEELHAFLQRHTPVATAPGVQQAATALEFWIDAVLDYQDIPGAAMAVVADQEVVWSRGFGLAHLEPAVPVATDTRFSICSISKLFTAIGVLQQRDAGALDLDDPVSEHLEWFDLPQSFPGSPQISVRALLTHSAGLPRESNHPYWDGPDFVFPSREEIIEELSAQRTLYPAETYFQYSNLGLTLAGEVLAAAADQPYSSYIDENILHPLGMHDTTPDIPGDLAGKQLATGYGRQLRDGDREPITVFEAKGIAPAAGFASTAEDLADFLRWQHRLLETDGREVLAANTLREAQRVHWVDPDWETTWGLGFAVRRIGDRTYVGHGGSCPGFRSEVLLDPKQRIGAVFLSNAMGVDTRSFMLAAHGLLGPAIEEARGKARTQPEEAEGEKSTGPDLDRYIGRYESAWGEGAIVRWGDGLASFDLGSTRNPAETMAKLEHESGHVFRRIREDGSRAERWIFEVNAAGEVVGMRQHGNGSRRIPGSERTP